MFCRDPGGCSKNKSDCCSVWEWRKSGIKMLVTARGLTFFLCFPGFLPCFSTLSQKHGFVVFLSWIVPENRVGPPPLWSEKPVYCWFSTQNQNLTPPWPPPTHLTPLLYIYIEGGWGGVRGVGVSRVEDSRQILNSWVEKQGRKPWKHKKKLGLWP